MLFDNDGCISRNVTRNLLFPFFVNKGSKSPYVNVLASGHRGFDDVEEGFNRVRDIGFVDSGLFSDLCDNVCFGHVGNF